ncbi:MAG TPA: Uma2 family endonuclease [Bryobacteraceae bacterium]|jgi:Uma2 family endonuclease|nr:Uma2 family endonuclease [Bryobacteraceae bacterium]
MSTSALMTVDEYLKLDVKPYCEYVDGVLYPKPVPGFLHGFVQLLLGSLLIVHAREFYASSEVRIKVRSGKYLLPGIAVVRPEDYESLYPAKPVFLCVDIASPDDRPGQLLAKCEEYHQWGVTHCWVIDPERRIAWIYDRDAEWLKLNESGTLIAGEIEIPLQEVFSQLPK